MLQQLPQLPLYIICIKFALHQLTLNLTKNCLCNENCYSSVVKFNFVILEISNVFEKLNKQSFYWKIQKLIT